MDTLRNMRVFVRVVECGGFTAAAGDMQVTTACVSRAVAELEVRIRTRLLNRTTRRVVLTEAGARYLQRCERILRDIDDAELEASGTQAHPSGTLRVHAPPTLGQYFVAPAIAKYKLAYPDVVIELAVGLESPDLLDDRYDVVVLVNTQDLQNSSLVAQRLGRSYSVLCASASYVERRGTPTTIDDLTAHTCCDVVTPFFSQDRWNFDGPDGHSALKLPLDLFRVNNAAALTGALVEGVGIGALPIANALPQLESGSLIRVLPEYRVQLVNLFALYPSRHFLDAKISTWLQILQHEVTERLTANESAIEKYSSTKRKPA